MQAGVLAANLEFEGKLRDGRIVSFSTEMPSTVAVFQRRSDGSVHGYVAHERESCAVTSSTLECSRSGTSPLAGTAYRYERLVGSRKDCGRKPVYAVYRCVRGCDEEAAPQVLVESSFCE